MPAETTCATCGYTGNHGFIAVGRYVGVLFYHGDCPGFILGDNGGEYRTRKAAFLAQCPDLGSAWAKMRVAQFDGKPKLAAKWRKAWEQEED